ncbi:MAG: TauD/TfdA family dioxygenase [Rhodospirillaceae bacterium]
MASRQERPGDAAGLNVRRLSPALGAEMRGVDLDRPLDDAVFARIHAAWLEHLVLVFPGQTLSERRQVEFAERLGTPVGQRSKERSDARTDSDMRVMLISNIRENGEPIGLLPDGELMFHTDSVYLERPLKGAMLYAEEIPSRGGNTLFVNMHMAYDALSPGMKALLEGLRAVHVFDYETQVKTGRLDRSGARNHVHPVVRTHPETGRRALYVNRLMTEEIVGMPEAESDALLGELFDHAERPEFIYSHTWRVGDLVLWDNRCTMHARTDFPANERRLMRRVGLEGDVPF